MTTRAPLPVGDVTLVDLLRRARARVAAGSRPVLTTYIEPLPGLEPLDAFQRAEGTEDRLYWALPSAGIAVAGIGAAVTISPSGAGRFAAAARMWRALLDGGLTGGPGALELDSSMLGDDRAMAFGRHPMLLGGFRFDPLRASDPAWRGYPDAWLAVPRLCLAVSPAGRWLASSVLVRPGDEPARLADGLERERDRLIGAGGTSEPATVWSTIADAFSQARPTTQRARAEISEARADADAAAGAAFMTAVAEGAEAVRAGSLEKVVIARSVDWRPPAPPDAVETLRRLTARYPECHIFAVARGRQTFLGASPERLVRVDGRVVRATSLAGSMGRGSTAELDGAQGAALMASAKDREEHAIVVRALTAGLAELCDDVVAPREPTLLTMPDVHHLYTPVTARLRDGVQLLDVVARLHPTPAVGGAPRDDALAFIRSHEKWDRGWYAAPVGWMDASGDGEFAVALRSALLDGDGATLFAGCGIMGDSDAAGEYAESELKLRAMREGLTGAAATASSVVSGAQRAANGDVPTAAESVAAKNSMISDGRLSTPDDSVAADGSMIEDGDETTPAESVSVEGAMMMRGDVTPAGGVAVEGAMTEDGDVASTR